MHYWNRDNFGGLTQLSAERHADGRMKDLSNYCELRERGLRKEAFQALERFLDFVLSLPTETRREIALRALYQFDKTGNFTAWCRERGRSYRWSMIVYYDPKN